MWRNFVNSGHLYWIIPLLCLDLFLKGYALWKAGRLNQSYWFVALFIINSLGILPIIYLVFFQRKPNGKKS